MLREVLGRAMGPPPPRAAGAGAGARPYAPPRDDYDDDDDDQNNVSELSWNKFFEEKRDVPLNGGKDVFRVYTSGVEGPWFVLFHGGGYTSLTWAIVARKLQRSNSPNRVLAFDCRAHGGTVTEDISDMSLEKQTDDAVQLIAAVCGEGDTSEKVLVGHSMGGSVATSVCGSGRVKGVTGLVVIDVVEGTAMASLSAMHIYIDKIPTSFNSPEDAVRWSLSSKSTKKRKAARISTPDRIKPAPDSTLSKWVWRTDLLLTEPYWRGWYQGLSQRFLACPARKVLLLAGTDRLDTALTIAQMQGKFRLTVLPDCGHCIQEDDPQRTTEMLLDMVRKVVIPPRMPAVQKHPAYE